jgi:hypothetical protein
MAVNENKGSDAPEELETPNGLLVPPKEGQAIFGGDAKTLKVTKDVNMDQLLHEVDARLGDPDRYHVVAYLEDFDEPVSEKNPLTLYVQGDADMRTVRGVVESHDKDEHFGLSDEERALNELKAKLKSGEDLPAAELNKLLRSIL